MEQYYTEEALRRGGRVLDLACGTGRFSIPLAAAGLDVVGGDLSARMLEQGRRNATRSGVAIDFRTLDMRGFDLEGMRFDTILIAANSLLHLHSRQDFRGFFASLRRHLAPNGRLLFDVFVPSLRLLTLGPEARSLVGTFAHPDLGEITLKESIRYEATRQLSHLVWFWSTPQAPDFWENALVLRQIFPEELPLLLELGGMTLIDRFGDFDRSPFSETSFRQVCVCATAP